MRTYAKDAGLNTRKFIKDQDDLLFRMIKNKEIDPLDAIMMKSDMMAELSDMDRSIGAKLNRGLQGAKDKARRVRDKGAGLVGAA